MFIARIISLLAIAALSVSAQAPRRVTIDDLMALRTINDVKISPAGDRVAYTVSTPSVERNAHEAALFVMPATGGTAKRLAESHRIFTPALPAPRLRWLPGGQMLSVLVAGATRSASADGQSRNERGHRGHRGSVGSDRVRVVAGRKVRRLSLARCGERSAADCEQGRRQSTGHAAVGAAIALRHAARPHAAGSIRRQLLLVAGREGDRLLVRAVRRIPGALLGEDFRRRDRRWRDASDHRSSGHERVAAVLARTASGCPSSPPASAPASLRHAAWPWPMRVRRTRRSARTR